MKTVFLFNPENKTLTMVIGGDRICYALRKDQTACEIAWSAQEMKCFIRAAGKIYKKENLKFSPGQKITVFTIKDVEAIRREIGDYPRYGYAFGDANGRESDNGKLVKDALWYVGCITESCCSGRCSDCPCHHLTRGEGDTNCISADLIRWRGEKSNKIKVMGV